jgi:hypothetical protein
MFLFNIEFQIKSNEERIKKIAILFWDSVRQLADQNDMLTKDDYLKIA